MSEIQVSVIYKVTETHIYGFFKEHRFLSNFEVADIPYEGIVYPHTEAAYHAAKTLDPYERERFLGLTPSQAKAAGRKLTLREGWDDIKDGIMEEVVRKKFVVHEDLKNKLISTGDKYLEETNWWGDIYWGVCNGIGQNKLGLLLMKIRKEILTQSQPL